MVHDADSPLTRSVLGLMLYRRMYIGYKLRDKGRQAMKSVFYKRLRKAMEIYCVIAKARRQSEDRKGPSTPGDTPCANSIEIKANAFLFLIDFSRE